ncbi:MAG TPA: hypothetical protein VK826_19620 [Bacteroidia bacterium]|nr:hypothetical protein [Bacteroidia bacterium]
MEQQNAAGAPATRPTLLTVLCILSFIGSGIAIVFYIIALLGAMALQAVVSVADSSMEAYADSVGGEAVANAEAAGDVASAGMGLVWAYVLIGILATIVALVGVIRMWKLKKSGFYLYTGATVVSMIMTVVYSGTESLAMGLIAPILFIVLYGLNLKHMK